MGGGGSIVIIQIWPPKKTVENCHKQEKKAEFKQWPWLLWQTVPSTFSNLQTILVTNSVVVSERPSGHSHVPMHHFSLCRPQSTSLQPSFALQLISKLLLLKSGLHLCRFCFHVFQHSVYLFSSILRMINCSI